ncbi:uncharacterized protein BcabD6B2_33250 [Babesia caballi]|uniref:Membrane protein, putative n=1 Tax=Babesia caballi TaxID=5871 RepID=A0AAV4LVX3_BABCB|nr:membrane protein, putative [Babesia caballi]
MSGPYSSSYTYKRPLVLNLDESKPREIQEVLLTTDGSMKYYAIAEKYRRNYLFSEVILQNFKFTFCEMGGEIDSYFDTITGVTYTSIDSWGKLDIQYLRNGTVHYEQYLKTPHSIGYVETLGTITPDGNKSYHIDSVMHNGVLLARLMLQNGSGVSLVEPGGLPSAVINFNQLTNSWVISYVVPLVVPKVELNYRLRIKLVYLNGAVTVDAVRNTLLVVTTVNGTELQDTTVHESVAAPVLWLETQRCTVIQSILVPKDEVKDRALLYSFVYVQDRAEIRCVVREAAKAAGEWRYNGKSSRADRDDDDAADDYVDVYRYPCANYAPVSLVVPERSSDVPQVHPKVAGRVRRVKQTTIFIVTMYRDTPHAVSDIHPSDLSWIHLPEMPKLPVKLDLNNTIPAEVSVTTASTTDTFFYVIDPKFKATHNISTLTVRDFKFEVDAEGREHDGTLDTITHVMHTVHDGMESLDVYYKQNSVAKVIFFVKEKGSEEFVETHGTHHVDRNRPPVLILATVGDTVIYRALMDNGEGESLIDPSGRCRVTVDVGRDTTEQRVWITLPIKLPDPGVKDELNIPVIYQNGRATLNLIPNVTKCRIVRRTVGGLAYTAPAVGPQYNKCLGMQLAALRWSQWWLLKAIVVPEVVHKARAKLYSFVYCPQHSTVFAIVQNARMYNNVWTADPEPVGAYRKPSVNVTHSLLRVPIQGSRLPQLYPPEAGWVRNLGQSRYYSVKFRGDSEAYGDDRRKDPILYIRVDGLPKKALELSPQEALPEGIEKFVLKEGSAWYYRLQWDYADTHYISRLLYKSIDFFVKEPEEGDAGANVILSVAVVSKNNEEHVDIHYRESGVNKYDKYVQHRGSMVFVKEKAAVRGTSAPPYGLDIITCGGSLVLKPQLQNSRGQSLVDANSYPGVISWLRGEHSETSLAVALPIKYPGTDAEDRLHMSFVFRRGKLQLHHFENADVLYKVLGTDKDGTPKFVPAVGREFMELSSIKTLAFDGDMHVVIRGTVVLNELVQNGAVAYFFLYDFASATLTCVSSYPLLEDGMYVFTGLFQDRYDLPAQNISQVHFDVPDNALQKYLVYPQEAATVIPLATEQWRALSLSRAKTCDEYKFHPDDTKFIGATGMPKIPIVLSLRDGHLKREAQAIALATPEGTYYRIDPTYAPTHLISTVDIEGLTGPVVKSPNLTLNDINEIVYVHVTRVGNWSRLAVYCSVNGEYYFREYVRENSQNNFRLTHGSLMPGVAPSYMIMTLSYRDRVALQVHLQSKSGQSLLDATETPTAVFYMEKGNQAGKAFVAFPIRYPKTKIKDRLQMTVSVTDDGMEYVPQWRGQSRNFVVTFGNEGNYTVSLPKSIEYKEYVKHDGRRREDSKEQHIIKTVMVPNGDNNSKTARVYTFLCDTRTHIITCNVAEARLEDGMWKINEHVDVEYMFPTTGVGAAAIDVVLRDGIPKPVVLPSAAARIKEPGEHLYIVVQKPPQARDGTDLHPMDVPNFASHMLPMIPVDLDLLHSIPLEVEVEMGESDNVTHYRVKQAFVKSHYIRRVTYGTFSSIIQSRREITSHRDGGSVFVIKECDEVNEFLYVGTEQGRKLMAKYQIENDHQTAKLTAVYHIGGRLSA